MTIWTAPSARWDEGFATLEPRVLLDATLGEAGALDVNGSADGVNHVAAIIEDNVTSVGLVASDVQVSGGDDLRAVVIEVEKAVNDREEALIFGSERFALNVVRTEPTALRIGGRDLFVAFDELDNRFTFTAADGGLLSSAEARAILTSGRYENVSQHPLETPRTITFSITDAAGRSALARTDVSLSGFNDAPVVEDDPISPDFEATVGGDGVVPSRSVAGLLAGATVLDPEEDVFGIAITGADSSQGAWEILHDGETEWAVLLDVGSAVPTGSVIPIGGDARIRFLANAGEVGASTISYRVWDGSSGTEGTPIADDSGSIRSSLSSRTLDTTATFTPEIRPVVSLADGEVGRVIDVVDIQHGSGTAWQVGDRHTSGSRFTANDLRRGDEGGYTWGFEGAAGEFGIATLFNARALTIDPEQGALLRISMSLDTIRTDRESGTVHLAVKQGSRTFYAAGTPFVPGDGSPARGVASDLTSDRFVAIDGSGERPDFSVDGAPLVFGIAFHGVIADGATAFDGGIGIDNGRFEFVRERDGGRSRTIALPDDGSFVRFAANADVLDGGQNDVGELVVRLDNVTDPAKSILRVGSINFPMSDSRLRSITFGQTRFELDYDAEQRRLTVSNADAADAALPTDDLRALLGSVAYADYGSGSAALSPRVLVTARDLEGNVSEKVEVVLQRRGGYALANDVRIAEIESGSTTFEFSSEVAPDLALDARIVATDGSVSFYGREEGAALVQVGATDTTVEWTVRGGVTGEGLALRIPQLSFEHGETLTVEKRYLRAYALGTTTDIRVVDNGDSLTFSSTADGRVEDGTLVLALRDVPAFTMRYGNTDTAWRNDFVHELSGVHLLGDAVLVRLGDRALLEVPANEQPLRIPVEDNGASILPAGATLSPGSSGTLSKASVVLANAGPGDELLVGAVPDGIVARIDTPADGVARIILSGIASTAEYRDAIAAVRIATDESATAAEDRIVSIILTDGERTTEAATVRVVFDFPLTVDLGGTGEYAGNDGTYVENQQPIPIATASAVVTDPEGRAAEATIVLRDGRTGDTLNVDSNVLGPLGVSAVARDGRTTLDTPGELHLTLFADADLTADEWVQVLRAISFEASTMTPERVEEGVRLVEVQLFDENANASNVAVARMGVREVPDIPHLDLDDASVDGEQSASRGDYRGTWVEGGGPVPLTDNPFASDLDDASFAAARVVAGNRFDGDRLLLDGVEVADGDTGTINGVNWFASGTATTLAVDFVGTAPIDAYRSILSSFSFDGTANPDDAVRRFTFQVDDGAASSAQRTARIDVQTVNTPPVAEHDGPIPLAEDFAAEGNVLLNDFDPDGDELKVQRFQIDGDPVVYDRGSTALIGGVGTMTIAGNGQWRFVPEVDYHGVVPDITYTIADPNGAEATARLLLGPVAASDDPPIADDDGYSVRSDEQLTGRDVLANDRDPDGDRLAVTLVNGVPRLVADGSAGGVATFTGSGGFAFDPENAFDDLSAGETRETVFTYTVSDPSGRTDQATVTVTVIGVNDAPRAIDDFSRGTEDEVQLANVLLDAVTGDFDPEGEPLSLVSVNGTGFGPDGTIAIPTDRGTLTVARDGNATFVPDNRANRMAAGEVWRIDLPYTATDGDTTAPATLTVLVDGLDDALVVIDPLVPATDPRDQSYDPRNPVRPGDSLNVIPDRLDLVDGTPMTPFDASPYFSDAEGDPITLALSNAPSWLRIENGVVRGTPPADASVGGPDGNGTYTITIVGGTPNGDRTETNVMLRVANIPPTAQDDAFRTGSFTPVTGSVLFDNGNGADRDGIPDADPLQVVRVGGKAGTTATGSGGGTFTILPTGRLRFEPGDDFADLPIGQTRTTSVEYAISDGAGGVDVASVVVTIVGENAPPRFADPAGPPPQEGWDSQPLPPFDLNAHVIDPEGRPLSFTMSGAPPWLKLDTVTGVITGTPPSDGSVARAGGYYLVTVVAEDDAGQVFVFDHEVVVRNPAPVFVGPEMTITVPAASPLTLSAAALFDDPDGDRLTFRAVGMPPGCALDPATGIMVGEAPSDASTWTVALFADDLQGGVARGPMLVTIVVEPEGDLPVDVDPEPVSHRAMPVPRAATGRAVIDAPALESPSGIVLSAVNSFRSLEGTSCLAPRSAVDVAISDPATSDAERWPAYRGDALDVRIDVNARVRIETVVNGDRTTLALRHHLPGHTAPITGWSLVVDGLAYRATEHEGVAVDQLADQDVVPATLEFELADGRTGAVPLRLDLSDGVVSRNGPVELRVPTVARQLGAIADSVKPPTLDADRLRAAFGA